MLRTNTVEAGTLDLIKRFMSDDRFNGFNLVGGTALALKVGHRKSIDIDLFSTSAFSAPDLAGRPRYPRSARTCWPHPAAVPRNIRNC